MSASIPVMATEHLSIDNITTGNIVLKMRRHEMPNKVLVKRFWNGMERPERAVYVRDTPEIEKGKGVTVEDLLKLMALHDKVLITSYESGDVYHEGLVKDVDAHTQALKPRGITARSED